MILEVILILIVCSILIWIVWMFGTKKFSFRKFLMFFIMGIIALTGILLIFSSITDQIDQNNQKSLCIIEINKQLNDSVYFSQKLGGLPVECRLNNSPEVKEKINELDNWSKTSNIHAVDPTL